MDIIAILISALITVAFERVIDFVVSRLRDKARK